LSGRCAACQPCASSSHGSPSWSRPSNTFVSSPSWPCRSPCARRIFAPAPVGTRYRAKGSFVVQIEGKLKTALDESRLLILGAQVLFGFQFEAVFQERFPYISDTARHMHGAGLVMMLISISLLIAPSLFHQI